MAWTTPRTWVAANQLTAAQLNVDVRDNSTFLRTAHGCRVYSSSATIATLTTATDTVLSFNAEDYDSDSFHDTVTNPSRITIPAGVGAGTYRLFASVSFANNGTGRRRVHFRKNGTTDIGGYGSAGSASGGPLFIAAYTEVVLASGDYIEVMAYQDSGGNLAVNGSTISDTTFGLSLIGS